MVNSEAQLERLFHKEHEAHEYSQRVVRASGKTTEFVELRALRGEIRGLLAGKDREN